MFKVECTSALLEPIYEFLLDFKLLANHMFERLVLIEELITELFGRQVKVAADLAGDLHAESPAVGL